jgi:predicted dithiol-disulfide oxidoreductase (DUF899 family)
VAPKGSPRDMNEWRATLRDPNIKFPGESSEYRRARNQLLEAEDELRRLNEQVAAKRRALPTGGLLAEDYVFESAVDGSEVRFSELFAPGKDTLVIYHMMFPRWSKDPRAGAPEGKTALLPLAEQPCPSCTSVVEGLNGPAAKPLRSGQPRCGREDRPRSVGHLRTGRGLAQSATAVLAEQHLQPRLSRGNAGGRAAPGPERVLLRRGRDPPPVGERADVRARRQQPLDPVWPIWGVLDLTPNGRGETAAYPSLQYE